MKQIEVLNTWRGLAITLVLMYHLVGIKFGFIGVDLFFIISGFLISQVLDLQKPLKYFFLNRALRLLPLYFLVLFCFFVCLPFFAKNICTASYYEINSIQYFFWLPICNIYFAIKGWTNNCYLLHFWSLSCEIQFYVIWSVVSYVSIHSIKKYLTVCVTFILAALLFRLLASYYYPTNGVLRYCFTLSRIDSFAMGSLIFILSKNQKLIHYKSHLFFTAIFSFSLCVIGYLLIEDWSVLNIYVSTMGYSLHAFFWASVMGYSLLQKNYFKIVEWLKRILANIGTLSYSIYVWHVPIIYLVDNFLPQNLRTVLIKIALIYTVSLFSYFLIEKPILKFKKR